MKGTARFRACATKASQLNPVLVTTVSVVLNVGADGKPVDAKATMTGGMDGALITCMQSAARALKFDAVSAPLNATIKIVIQPKS